MSTAGIQLGGRPEWASSLTRPAVPREDDARATFASILGRASGVEEKPKSAEERAREAARQFVSVALVQPLLKQLRETNGAAAPFAPSQGEKQFQGLMDADLALKITGAAHFPLVDRLAHDLMKRGADVKDAGGER